MLKHILNLIFLLVIVKSFTLLSMTRETVQNLKRYPDFTHHVIFFHQPTIDHLKQDLEPWSEQQDIKFYINDCKSNKMNECDHPQNNPALIIFNRVIIKYNDDPNNFKRIIQWLQSRIIKNTVVIQHQHQLVQLLQKTPNYYCLCASDKNTDDVATFFALAKSLPFLNYCVIKNQIYYGQLGFKTGNITFFKNSTDNRQLFPYPNRLQHWQWFVKTHMLKSIIRAPQLANHRFSQEQKNIDAIVLTCDFSYRCEKVWQKVRDLEHSLNQEALGYPFYIALQDKRQSYNFNLYFHLALDMTKLPALIRIQMKTDRPAAGKAIRHIKYIDLDFDLNSLTTFRESVNNGQIEPVVMSAKVPKKNGFTGKGSQKFIQKLVGTNAESIIAASDKHYILLITALNVGCNQCDSFYKDYKQVASLLVERDITFGVLDLNHNEVHFNQIQKLPEILLFNKDDKSNPVRMEISHRFEHLRNFLRDKLGNYYFDVDQL